MKKSSQSLLRVGAVNYLNSKPLIYGFEKLASQVNQFKAVLACDLPSRLADSLAADRYDVALIPAYEYFLDPTYQIVSDACVAADGPVASVKVYFRTPPEKVRRLALDEGSRTSAALCRVLLNQRYGIKPILEPLPIGAGLANADTDAVLLIGDRAIHPPALPEQRRLVTEWDLGEEWRKETGLPFVFACWVARAGIATPAVDRLLSGCRDEGVAHFADIAKSEAPGLGLSVAQAERYLRENLRFRLGQREQAGLNQFREACFTAGLIESPSPDVFDIATR